MLPDVLALALTNHYEGDLSGYTSTYLQGRLNEVVDKFLCGCVWMFEVLV